MEVCFATGNAGKFREAQQIMDINIIQEKLELPEYQGTPEEVARAKAEHAYALLKKPVFVDDTGLAFNALHGMPGIYIKHFLDALGHEKLVRILADFDDKTAQAMCIIGYCDGKETKTFSGSVSGTIVMPRVMEGTFAHGWDPIFQPEGYTKTYGELPPEEKNAISHRRQALMQFNAFLKN